MSEIVKVALDCMGGDNAPGEIVKGGVEAVNSSENIEVMLYGDSEKIKESLKGLTYE